MGSREGTLWYLLWCQTVREPPQLQTFYFEEELDVHQRHINRVHLQDKDFHLIHVPGKEVHEFVPDALSRLCENNIPPKVVPVVASLAMLLAALEPTFHIPSKIFNVISEVHNTEVGHV